MLTIQNTQQTSRCVAQQSTFTILSHRHELYYYYITAAVSQREHTQYYPYLKNEKESILDLIVDFYLSWIRPKFLLKNFVFDCYVDKHQKVFLIDFNVWGQSTDSLLFDWEELNEYCFGENHRTVFRLVESEGEVRHNPLASYRAPIDAIDLASDSLGTNSFEEFISLCSKNQK